MDRAVIVAEYTILCPPDTRRKEMKAKIFQFLYEDGSKLVMGVK